MVAFCSELLSLFYFNRRYISVFLWCISNVSIDVQLFSRPTIFYALGKDWILLSLKSIKQISKSSNCFFKFYFPICYTCPPLSPIVTSKTRFSSVYFDTWCFLVPFFVSCRHSLQLITCPIRDQIFPSQCPWICLCRLSELPFYTEF